MKEQKKKKNKILPMLFGKIGKENDMLKLDIQMFADGKVVIDTELNTKNFENGLDKMKSTS